MKSLAAKGGHRRRRDGMKGNALGFKFQGSSAYSQGLKRAMCGAVWNAAVKAFRFRDVFGFRFLGLESICKFHWLTGPEQGRRQPVILPNVSEC